MQSQINEVYEGYYTVVIKVRAGVPIRIARLEEVSIRKNNQVCKADFEVAVEVSYDCNCYGSATRALVIIIDERHGKPIALGEALYDAEEAKNIKRGTIIKNVHYVGDKAWNELKHITSGS